jgi:molybdate transport system substrate-binding protein
MRILALALVLVALVAAGCGDDDDDSGESSAGEGGQEQRLIVSAAASMTEALEACAPDFGDAEETEVRLSFAGSDELAAQIRQGVKPDVFAAANTALPDELHDEDLVEQPVEFATNEFVLAVPADSDIEAVDDLTESGIKIAIGSESVPIGSYTRELLAKLRPAQGEAILDNVRSNEPDVKGIVGKVSQGAADAGFVYVTDVNATDGALKAIELPAAVEPEITYAAAVVKGAKNPRDAQAFVDGLTNGPCAQALADAGFGSVQR